MKRSLVLLVIGLTLMPSLTIAGEAEWRSHHEAGIAAAGRFDLGTAADRLEAAVREAQEFGEQDQRLGATLSFLGYVYRNLARVKEGEEYFRRGLMMLEKALGTEYAAVTTSLVYLGEVQRFQGSLAESEASLQRAISILEKTSGPEPPMLGMAFVYLGDLQFLRELYVEADSVYQRGATIVRHVSTLRRTASLVKNVTL